MTKKIFSFLLCSLFLSICSNDSKDYEEIYQIFHEGDRLELMLVQNQENLMMPFLYALKKKDLKAALSMAITAKNSRWCALVAMAASKDGDASIVFLASKHAEALASAERSEILLKHKDEGESTRALVQCGLGVVGLYVVQCLTNYFNRNSVELREEHRSEGIDGSMIRRVVTQRYSAENPII